MKNPSRFHKERALRQAGYPVPPFPVAPADEGLDAATRLQADRSFLDACAAWEDTIDTRYLALIRSLPPIEPSPGVRDFIRRCDQYGLTAGLTGLNGRVPHRYTAVYQLDHETLRNIELVDKVGEARPDYLAAVPLGTSFCQFVLRDGAFLTSDSASDHRLDGHPYQGVMVSYHGVPVLDTEGELYGSLCHFDVNEQPLSDAEFAHLQGVASAIAPYLKSQGTRD